VYAARSLGVDLSVKYGKGAGPWVNVVADLVWSAVAWPAEAERNVTRRAITMAFNYSSKSPDAQAKNYALLHDGGGGVRLDPIYDAAT